LWRAGEMELEFADFDTDESIAPEHFHSKDGLRNLTAGVTQQTRIAL
jgi:hypothetical protein